MISLRTEDKSICVPDSNRVERVGAENGTLASNLVLCSSDSICSSPSNSFANSGQNPRPPRPWLHEVEAGAPLVFRARCGGALV
jgi:hypothetical protein